MSIWMRIDIYAGIVLNWKPNPTFLSLLNSFYMQFSLGIVWFTWNVALVFHSRLPLFLWFAHCLLNHWKHPNMPIPLVPKMQGLTWNHLSRQFWWKIVYIQFRKVLKFFKTWIPTTFSAYYILQLMNNDGRYTRKNWLCTCSTISHHSNLQSHLKYFWKRVDLLLWIPLYNSNYLLRLFLGYLGYIY